MRTSASVAAAVRLAPSRFSSAIATCSRGKRGATRHRASDAWPARFAHRDPARRRRCRRRMRIARVDERRRNHAQRLEAMDPGRTRDARRRRPARRHRRRRVSQLRAQHVGKPDPGTHAGGIGRTTIPLRGTEVRRTPPRSLAGPDSRLPHAFAAPSPHRCTALPAGHAGIRDWLARPHAWRR